MQCRQCGTGVPDGARFCPTCATPIGLESTTEFAPQAVVGAGGARPSITPIVATITVVILLLVGGIALVMTQGGDDPENSSSGQAGGTSPSVSVSSTSTPGTAAPETTDATVPGTEAPESTVAPTTAIVDPIAAATAELFATIDADRARVDAHLDRWVPQISAKRDGLEWQGIDYDLPAILALHQLLDAQYTALLINGADYNFRLAGNRMDGWFITIVEMSWDTPEGALGWCIDNGIDRNNCAAKLITNDQGVTRTLVLQ